MQKEDKVNNPSHYLWLKDKVGIEVIDITRHNKAIWYINDKIKTIENEVN